VIQVSTSVVVFLQRTSIRSDFHKSEKALIKPAMKTQDSLVAFGDIDRSYLMWQSKYSCCRCRQQRLRMVNMYLCIWTRQLHKLDDLGDKTNVKCKRELVLMTWEHISAMHVKQDD